MSTEQWNASLKHSIERILYRFEFRFAVNMRLEPPNRQALLHHTECIVSLVPPVNNQYVDIARGGVVATSVRAK